MKSTYEEEIQIAAERVTVRLRKYFGDQAGVQFGKHQDPDKTWLQFDMSGPLCSVLIAPGVMIEIARTPNSVTSRLDDCALEQLHTLKSEQALYILTDGCKVGTK